MKGHMYHKTLRRIPLCNELLVWYGDAYGEYLASLHDDGDEDENDEDEDYDEDDDDEENYDVDEMNSLNRGANKSLWEEWKLKLKTLTRTHNMELRSAP